MSFNYTVTVTDDSHSSLDAALQADVAAAAAQWSKYLTGLGTLDISVTVTATTRANGGPATFLPAGSANGINIYEPGTIRELNTGTDPNGSSPDILIQVDPTYLKSLSLDPNAAPGAGQTDGLSVFMHEIGHGLGIVSYRDPSTGTLPGYGSTWDKYSVINADGSASFVGPNAEAVYGGPVSITTLKNGEQYSHLANSVSERDGHDLMNGVQFNYGTRYPISDLDLAILKDLGANVTGSVGDYPTQASGEHLNPVYRFYDTVTNDHFYTIDAGEKASIQANLRSFTYEGAPWSTPDKSTATLDVYRFYDTVTKTHFLTTSAAERDQLIQTLPSFKYEGVAFEAYKSVGNSDEFALERFYNTNSKVHTYAANASEVDLIKSGAVGSGWVDEGPSFIVHRPTGTASSPSVASADGTGQASVPADGLQQLLDAAARKGAVADAGSPPVGAGGGAWIKLTGVTEPPALSPEAFG